MKHLTEYAIWKDIEGFGGKYQVSNTGQVKSLKREYVPKDKILKGKIDNEGYLSVVLSVGSVRKTKNIHRLVAEAFVPNPDKKRTVNHINEIKTDNALSA